MHMDYLNSCGFWITIAKQSFEFMYWNLQSNMVQVINSQQVTTLAPIKPYDSLTLPKLQQEWQSQSNSNTNHTSPIFFEIGFAAMYGIALNKQLFLVNLNKKQLSLTLGENLETRIRDVTFSDQYQILFLARFHHTVEMLQLNPKYCDFQRRESKIQGKAITQSLALKPHSSTLLVLQQSGQLRLWNFLEMICYQTINVGFPLPFLLCLDERLIVGGYRVGSFVFINQQSSAMPTKLKRFISCGIVTYQYFVVALSDNSIRCINNLTGKTEKVIQSVFESEQSLKLFLNSNSGTVSVLGTHGTLKSFQPSTGDFFRKLHFSKDVNCCEYENVKDLYYSCNAKTMTICSINPQGTSGTPEFRDERTLTKIHPHTQILAVNYFSGVFALLTDTNVLYIVRQSSLTIIHSFMLSEQVVANDQLLAVRFLCGTEAILLIYKNSVHLLYMERGSPEIRKGVQTKSYFYVYQLKKVPEQYLPDPKTEEYFTAVELTTTLNEEQTLLTTCNLFLSTSKGSLYKIVLSYLNLPLTKSRFRSDVEMRALSMSFDIMKFNFANQAKQHPPTPSSFGVSPSFSTEIFPYSLDYEPEGGLICPESTFIKTKLKSIRGLSLHANRLMCWNFNMLLIYSTVRQEKLSFIGEINIDLSYPVQWMLGPSQPENQYAAKLLDYIEPQIDKSAQGSPIKQVKARRPTMQKNFVTTEQLEKLVETKTNLFKKRVQITQREDEVKRIISQSKTVLPSKSLQKQEPLYKNPEQLRQRSQTRIPPSRDSFPQDRSKIVTPISQTTILQPSTPNTLSMLKYSHRIRTQPTQAVSSSLTQRPGKALHTLIQKPSTKLKTEISVIYEDNSLPAYPKDFTKIIAGQQVLSVHELVEKLNLKVRKVRNGARQGQEQMHSRIALPQIGGTGRTRSRTQIT